MYLAIIKPKPSSEGIFYSHYHKLQKINLLTSRFFLVCTHLPSTLFPPFLSQFQRSERYYFIFLRPNVHICYNPFRRWFPMAQAKVRLPLDLDPEIYQQIEQAAKIQGTSKKQIIITALKIAKIITE